MKNFLKCFLSLFLLTLISLPAMAVEQNVSYTFQCKRVYPNNQPDGVITDNATLTFFKNTVAGQIWASGNWDHVEGERSDISSEDTYFSKNVRGWSKGWALYFGHTSPGEAQEFSLYVSSEVLAGKTGRVKLILHEFDNSTLECQ